MSDDVCERLNHRPAIRVALLVGDTVYVRDWCMCESGTAPFGPGTPGPPEWLDAPLMRWDHPQDPVTYSGTVADGEQANALELIGAA